MAGPSNAELFLTEYQDFQTNHKGGYFNMQKLFEMPSIGDRARNYVLSALAEGITHFDFMGVGNHWSVKAKTFAEAADIIINQTENPSPDFLNSLYNFNLGAAESLYSRGKNSRLVRHFLSHAGSYASRLALQEEPIDGKSTEEWFDISSKLMQRTVQLCEEGGDPVDLYRMHIFASEQAFRYATTQCIPNNASEGELLKAFTVGIDHIADALLTKLNNHTTILKELAGKFDIEYSHRVKESANKFDEIFFELDSILEKLALGSQSDLIIKKHLSPKNFEAYFQNVIPSVKIIALFEAGKMLRQFEADASPIMRLDTEYDHSLETVEAIGYDRIRATSRGLYIFTDYQKLAGKYYPQINAANEYVNVLSSALVNYLEDPQACLTIAYKYMRALRMGPEHLQEYKARSERVPRRKMAHVKI